jgi:hypothetical protein
MLFQIGMKWFSRLVSSWISRRNLWCKVPQIADITHCDTQTFTQVSITLLTDIIGRTMAMCKKAFEMLHRPSQTPTFQAIPHVAPGAQISNKRKAGPESNDQRTMTDPVPKRRQSTTETKSGTREIAPKPSNGSPGPVGSMTGKIPKKRGRPSKADVERNKQEAIAKGVIMAPIITLSTGSPQRPPDDTSGYAPIAPTPLTSTTGTFYDPTVRSTSEPESQESQPGDAAGKKKRRPPIKQKVGSPVDVLCVITTNNH